MHFLSLFNIVTGPYQHLALVGGGRRYSDYDRSGDVFVSTSNTNYSWFTLLKYRLQGMSDPKLTYDLFTQFCLQSQGTRLDSRSQTCWLIELYDVRM